MVNCKIPIFDQSRPLIEKSHKTAFSLPSDPSQCYNEAIPATKEGSGFEKYTAKKTRVLRWDVRAAHPAADRLVVHPAGRHKRIRRKRLQRRFLRRCRRGLFVRQRPQRIWRGRHRRVGPSDVRYGGRGDPVRCRGRQARGGQRPHRFPGLSSGKGPCVRRCFLRSQLPFMLPAIHVHRNLRGHVCRLYAPSLSAGHPGGCRSSVPHRSRGFRRSFRG